MFQKASSIGVVLAVVVGLAAVALMFSCDFITPLAPQQVVTAQPTVYVFHAKWCTNCPTPLEIKAMKGKYRHINIVDVDTDSKDREQQLLKFQYDISTIPKFVIITPNKMVWITDKRKNLERWLSEVEKMYEAN